MTTYRGSPVDTVEFNRKDDVFRLLNIDGEIMAELKRHEFLSQPQLRTMRLSNGRHRRTRAAFRGNPAGQPGFAWSTGAVVSPRAGWFAFGSPEPAKPIEDAGIRAGEVIAHRCWRIVGDRLHSAYKRQHAWAPDQPMTGDVRHEYGVHAFKDAAYLGDYIMGIRMLDSMAAVMIDWNSGEIVKPMPTPIAVGTIALWGEIVEHERGYRAEFGKVISLDRAIGGKDPEILDRLREVYRLNHPVGGRQQPVDHSAEECPNFPGCHCADCCIDGWKHPSQERQGERS